MGQALLLRLDQRERSSVQQVLGHGSSNNSNNSASSTSSSQQQATFQAMSMLLNVTLGDILYLKPNKAAGDFSLHARKPL
jgi:hypothetical protein